MSTRRGDNWQCDHGAQYFTVRHPLFRAEVERWLKAGVAALWQPRLKVFGGSDEHSDDASLQRYVGVPRMTAPARWLAQGMQVLTGVTVQSLRPHDGGWKITTHEQGELAPVFLAVVIAVPAPQAHALLHICAPLLADVAQLATMRPCWAMMLNYAAPLAVDFDAAFVNEGPLRWVSRDSSKPGRSGAETWLLHANPTWSATHIDAAPDSIAPELLAAFAQLGGTAPVSWSLHRWRYADTDPPLQHRALWDTALGLGLCGDWLNGGKVEGAWLSGHDVAEQILLTLDQRKHGRS